MFRIAPIALLAASLCSLAAAQTVPNKAIKQVPAASGTVINKPLADGTVINEPSAGDMNAQAAADGTVIRDVQPKPVDKPLPFAGLAYLELSVNAVGLHAFVHGAEEGFVGVVGLSLTPNLTHFFTGLPPLLSDAVVMAYGFTSTQDLELTAPILYWPAEAIMVFGQAVIIDEHGLWASGIVPVVIGEDANGNGNVNGSDQAGSDQNAADKARAKAAELAQASGIIK